MSDNVRGALSLVGVLVAAISGVAFYALWNLPKAWHIILPMRLTTAGAFLVAAAAVGCATVVFHTITQNTILTPSLLGFDALYMLINTVLVYTLGATALLRTDHLGFYFLTVTLMVVFALVLFAPLVLRPRVSIDALLLIGVTFGLLIRSITMLLQRLLDPRAHMILADTFFASFETVDLQELVVSALVVSVTALGLWLSRHHLNVLSLGRDRAVVLGLRYRRAVIGAITAIAVLMAVATELVGPLMFLGLIVAHIAYALCGSMRHTWTIPVATVVGCALLSWGQFLLDRLLNDDTPVSVIIEFFGGVLLLIMLVKRRRKVA